MQNIFLFAQWPRLSVKIFKINVSLVQLCEACFEAYVRYRSIYEYILIDKKYTPCCIGAYFQLILYLFYFYNTTQMVIAVTFGYCRLDIILIDNVLVIFNILFLSRIKNYIQNIIRIGFRSSIVLNAFVMLYFFSIYIFICVW